MGRAELVNGTGDSPARVGARAAARSCWAPHSTTLSRLEPEPGPLSPALPGVAAVPRPWGVLPARPQFPSLAGGVETPALSPLLAALPGVSGPPTPLRPGGGGTCSCSPRLSRCQFPCTGQGRGGPRPSLQLPGGSRRPPVPLPAPAAPWPRHGLGGSAGRGGGGG